MQSCHGALDVLAFFAEQTGMTPIAGPTMLRGDGSYGNARLESERPYPTVLVGDLNEWFLWGRPLRRLHAHFGATPAPATYPAGWPVFALDRMWVKPLDRLLGVTVHNSPLARQASDHLPLLGRFHV